MVVSRVGNGSKVLAPKIMKVSLNWICRCSSLSSLYTTLQIAVEGCCHGCLDTIYNVLTAVEEREGYKIDLLICCGDFEVLDLDLRD